MPGSPHLPAPHLPAPRHVIPSACLLCCMREGISVAGYSLLSGRITDASPTYILLIILHNIIQSFLVRYSRVVSHESHVTHVSHDIPIRSTRSIRSIRSWNSHDLGQLLTYFVQTPQNISPSSHPAYLSETVQSLQTMP